MNITMLAMAFDICGPCTTCENNYSKRVFYQTMIDSDGFDLTVYTTRTTSKKFMTSNNMNSAMAYTMLQYDRIHEARI